MPDFNKEYMDKREHLIWRAPIVCDAIEKALPFQSLIDVGCGPGEMVAEFLRREKDAWGMDSSDWAGRHVPRDRFIAHNLRRLYLHVVHFDVALCFEVASVMDDHYMLSHNLQYFSNVILMTQPGRCEEILPKFGYVRDSQIEKAIQKELEPWKRKLAIKAIYYGLAAFKRC